MLNLPNVYTIPPGLPFAKVLAQSLWDEYQHDLLALSDVEIYLPNRRSCRSLAETFLEVSSGQATILPRMTPLGDIDDDDLLETDPFILDEDPYLQPAIPALERQILLMQLILKRGDLNLSVTEAFSLAADFAALIDRAHTENVDLKKIDTLVSGDLAEHWKITVDFLKIVMEAWPMILAERNQVDPAYRRNILLKKKADSLRQNPPKHRVIAAGSTGSILASATLLDVIARLPNGCVVLPSFDPSIDDKTWQAIDEQHPYFFLKRLIELFTIEPKQIKIWPSIDASMLTYERREKEKLLYHALQPKEIFDLSSIKLDKSVLEKLSFTVAENPNHEARIVSLMLRDVLNHPGKTAIVVTSNRDLAQKIQLEMRRWDILIDDSAGYKLDQTSVGIYLRLLADYMVTTTPATHALSVLRNPLTHLGKNADDLRNETAALEKELRKKPLPSGGLEGFLKRNDNPLLTSLLSSLSPFSEGKSHTLKEWIQNHITIAEQLTTTDEIPGAENLWIDDDGEAAAVLLHTLLAVPSVDHITLNGQDYAAFIGTALQQVTLRPNRRLHPRLRILSPIEARLQQADLFILAGVNENIWPSKIKKDTWLSRPMRKTLGFLDSDARIGQAALDFVSLFCAPHVTTTWSIQREDGLSHPSRWLQQIFAVMKKFSVEHDATASDYHHSAKIWDRPARLSAQKAPAPNPPIRDRPLKMGVTSVEKWQKDPYTIYAKNILNLYPQDDLDRSISMMDWGSAVHKIIENFFSEKAHLSSDPSARFDALATAVFAQYSLNPSQQMKWTSRLGNIKQWIIEEAHDIRHDILVETEKSYDFPLPDGRVFNLSGRADRLDVTSHGLTITDFKTGKAPTRSKLADGSSPQLPLLGLIFKQDYPTIHSLRYIQLPGTEREPAKVDEFLDSDELIQSNKANLERLLTKYYIEGKAYEAAQVDRHDNYKHLKRVAEWAVGSSDESEEETL